MSTLATLQAPVVVFREEQNFDWRVYTLCGLLEIGTLLGCAQGRAWSFELVVALAGALAVGALLIAVLLHMTTEANPAVVRVWFGWAPIYRRVILISSIRQVEVVSFRPIADYGFWGFGWGKNGERALFARGNQGVRITLNDGSRLLIVSQRPVALATAIEHVLHPGG